MAIESIILSFFGIILLAIGIVQRKYSEFWLKVFGAKLLILVKEKTRIKVLRIVGLVFIALGIVFIIFGVIRTLF